MGKGMPQSEIYWKDEEQNPALKETEQDREIMVTQLAEMAMEIA